MMTGKSEVFDTPHNECPTAFLPDSALVGRNNDGTYSLRRPHLIPAKPRGSGETTNADHVWLDEKNHWNVEEFRVKFSTVELAQAHWAQFCDIN